MLFEAHASSTTGPRCYQHGKEWREDCSWCQQAKQQVSVWEENKQKAVAHEERLKSGEWSIINLAIELNDHLFERRFGDDTLEPHELLEWAFRLAERVREQTNNVNYPLIEKFGHEIITEFRAQQPLPLRELPETKTPGNASRPSGLAERH
jgi:hypothetical protein